MNQVTLQLTVCFDAPFWIALAERTVGSRYEVCKITFGAEPKDYEVYNYLLRHWADLSFSPAVHTRKAVNHPVNPKRLQRSIRRQLCETTAIGTKAQQALALQREQCKTERKRQTRELREAEKQRQFELRQAKKHQKHRGH